MVFRIILNSNNFDEQFKKDMNDTESKNKPSIYLYINNDRNIGSIIWPG